MATMQPDVGKQLKELYAAVNAGDIEKFLSFHTDDVVNENIPTGVVRRGKEELRTFLENSLAVISDFKMELVSFIASGNRVCEEYSESGTLAAEYMGIPATGKSFSVRGVLIRELSGGKTCRVTTYFDPATLMRQLGVLPTPSQK